MPNVKHYPYFRSLLVMGDVSILYRYCSNSSGIENIDIFNIYLIFRYTGKFKTIQYQYDIEDFSTIPILFDTIFYLVFISISEYFYRYFRFYVIQPQIIHGPTFDIQLKCNLDHVSKSSPITIVHKPTFL